MDINVVLKDGDDENQIYFSSSSCWSSISEGTIVVGLGVVPDELYKNSKTME
jgi:hypothetical protein